MKSGFTGTRRGITFDQRCNLLDEFRTYGPSALHHGDCHGGDTEAHNVFRTLFPRRPVVVHPPVDARYASGLAGRNVTRLDPKPFLDRNIDIVNAVDYMFACPAEEEEQLRSGTWATIRYALKVEKPLTIFLPSGGIKRHNWRF